MSLEYNIHVFGCLVAAYSTVVHNDLIFSSTGDSYSGLTLWLGVRKSIWPVKKLSNKVLAWLSV